MRAFSFLVLALLLIPALLSAQSNPKPVPSPAIHDFAPTLQFLASPELEGREPGTRGATLAADYIASMMQNMGLIPYNNQGSELKTVLSDYFQSFDLKLLKVQYLSFVIGEGNKRKAPLRLLLGNDFSPENISSDLSIESDMLFAGYGINAPELNYNDYQDMDIKGKVVVLLGGYPGQHDTLSLAWQRFKKPAVDDEFDFEMRCREAERSGASAIIIIDKQYLKSINNSPVGTGNFIPKGQSFYTRDYYRKPQNGNISATCFILTDTGSSKFAGELNIDFIAIEKQIANQLTYTKIKLQKQCAIDLKIVPDTLHLNNVLGLLPGLDTSVTVILGAHYDHLGKRGEKTIYYGSDDNASGVAGLLALAEMWTESSIVPPCNILFASWTAEEKGLIGSNYFAENLASPEKVKLYINMDMISRSVKEDTAGRQLSIGTRTTDEYIRKIARESNSTLQKPFELDLWDVTGHSGSDYASFTAKNIPIMTYNTGLHDDYHTPRDIPASADLIKMGDVLKVVNGCLESFMETMIKK